MFSLNACVKIKVRMSMEDTNIDDVTATEMFGKL